MYSMHRNKIEKKKHEISRKINDNSNNNSNNNAENILIRM